MSAGRSASSIGVDREDHIMVTIGIDPHKQTHSAVAVNELGVQITQRTVAARLEGFGELVEWGRALDLERVWVVEDVRHVSGSLERFLLDRGETIVRLPPRLMADARRGVRDRGKSDPIDALAIARAALREGTDTLAAAKLAGVELEIRLIGVHRERLVNTRTRLSNELRWQLHDLWPEWDIRRRVLIHPGWQTKIHRRLSQAQPGVRVQISRDLINRVRELTRTITKLYEQLATLVAQAAPQLLAERGVGVLIAAKLIGEIAGIDRFTSDAQLARISGCAPIPASSGRSDRHRLDPGGNRQLNHAFHMLALTRLMHDPQTAGYIQKQRERGKTNKEALRNLKRHLVRRVYRLLKDPQSVPITVCLTYRYENSRGGASRWSCPAAGLASLVPEAGASWENADRAGRDLLLGLRAR
jgi:transposase